MSGRNIRTKRIAQIGSGSTGGTAANNDALPRGVTCHWQNCIEPEDAPVADCELCGDYAPRLYRFTFFAAGQMQCGDDCFLSRRIATLRYHEGCTWREDQEYTCEDDSKWRWWLSIGEPLPHGDNATQLTLRRDGEIVLTYRLPWKRNFCCLCENYFELQSGCPPYVCQGIPEAVCLKPVPRLELSCGLQTIRLPYVLFSGRGQQLLYDRTEELVNGTFMYWYSGPFSWPTVPSDEYEFRWMVMAFCHAGIASASGFMQARVPGESVWRSDWLVSLSHTASLEPFLVVENWNCCTDYLAPGQFYSMCPDTTPEDCGSGPHPLWLETFSE